MRPLAPQPGIPTPTLLLNKDQQVPPGMGSVNQMPPRHPGHIQSEETEGRPAPLKVPVPVWGLQGPGVGGKQGPAVTLPAPTLRPGSHHHKCLKCHGHPALCPWLCPLPVKEACVSGMGQAE